MFRLFCLTISCLCFLASSPGFSQETVDPVRLSLFSDSLAVIGEREENSPFDENDLEALCLPLLDSESPLIEFAQFNFDGEGGVLGLRASNELGELVYFAYNHLDSDASILFSDGFVLSLQPNSLVGEFAQFSTDLVLDDLVGEFLLDGLSSSVAVAIGTFKRWDGFGATYEISSNGIAVVEAGLNIIGAISVTGTDYADSFTFYSAVSGLVSLSGGGGQDSLEFSDTTESQIWEIEVASSAVLSTGSLIVGQEDDVFSIEAPTEILFSDTLIFDQEAENFISILPSKEALVIVGHLDDGFVVENDHIDTESADVLTFDESNRHNIVVIDSSSTVSVHEMDLVLESEVQAVDEAETEEQSASESNLSKSGGGAFGIFILFFLALLLLKSGLSHFTIRKNNLVKLYKS